MTYLGMQSLWNSLQFLCLLSLEWWFVSEKKGDWSREENRGKEKPVRAENLNSARCGRPLASGGRPLCCRLFRVLSGCKRSTSWLQRSTSSRQTQGEYLQAVDLLITAVNLFKADSRWVSTSARPLDSNGRPFQGRLTLGINLFKTDSRWASTTSRQTQGGYLQAVDLLI